MPVPIKVVQKQFSVNSPYQSAQTLGDINTKCFGYSDQGILLEDIGAQHQQ
jgi:hypothetical protein